MSDVIISVENLGKKYRISHQAERQRYVALRDVIAEKARGFFRNLKPEARSQNPDAGHSSLVTRHSSENFWALKDVSFEVKRGEVVGIIGRNGAGKSTLLKILSRITEPTTGRVHLRGRVASLLEVGTGFHPELTGRENIFLNGAILGMSRAEIRKKFDEIVAFSEVEKFLDTPVKRYSSGMYVRLAFAVAAHLEPEILIVDEVLAVGDAQFQKKCLSRMENVAKKDATTVLLVSHNMGTIQSLTRHTILLNRGRIQRKGDSDKVIQEYLESTNTSQQNFDFRNAERLDALLGLRTRICQIQPLTNGSDSFLFGQNLRFLIELESREAMSALRFGVTISDVSGAGILTTTTENEISIMPGRINKFCLTLHETNLAPGYYIFSMSVGIGDLYEGRLHYDIINPGPTFIVESMTQHGKALHNWMPGYGQIVLPKAKVSVVKND